MLKQQPIDWNAEAAKAREMSEAFIHASLADLLGSLETADLLDRETGNDRGGYYRDQCSILRAELKRREKEAARAARKRCTCRGKTGVSS